MKCPKCNNPARVLDTRVREGGFVRRRKECTECGARFSTLELLLREGEPTRDMHTAVVAFRTRHGANPSPTSPL